jgi:hypothetical protein
MDRQSSARLGARQDISDDEVIGLAFAGARFAAEADTGGSSSRRVRPANTVAASGMVPHRRVRHGASSGASALRRRGAPQRRRDRVSPKRYRTASSLTA